jgi:hypothetical protein
MAPAELDAPIYGLYLQETHISLGSIHGSCLYHHHPYVGASKRLMLGCVTQIVYLDYWGQGYGLGSLASGGGSVLVNFREEASSSILFY